MRAIAFGYSCHNTVLSDYEVSGDWAGYAEEQYRKIIRARRRCLYRVAGRRRTLAPRDGRVRGTYGHTIAYAAGEVLRGKMKPVDGRIRAVYAVIDLPFQKPDRADYEANPVRPA